MSVEEFSACIRAQRLLSGVPTQTMLARALGVSVASVASWEDGVTTPRPELLDELERALGFPAGTLGPLLGA